MQYKSKDVQRYFPLIAQNCFSPDAHRTVRLIAYQCLKNMHSQIDIQWDIIAPIIYSDINTQDQEIQKQAFSFLILFPLNCISISNKSLDSVQFLREYEQLIHVRYIY